MKIEHPTLSRCALMALFAIVFLSLTYRMQAYAPFLFSASSRLALYLGLLLLMIVLRQNLGHPPLAILALFGSVALTGIHTLLDSNLETAVHATGRFVNVMLLATFAALLFTSGRPIQRVIWLYWVVFIAAFCSLLAQHGGGSLDTLVKGYIAIRGDLIRHMTLVGEPNVGGMLAVIALVSSVVLIRQRAPAVAMGGVAVAFVFFSLSKAALLGVAVAAAASLLILPRAELKEAVLRAVMAAFLGLLLMLSLDAQDYARVMFESVLGTLRGEPSALKDFESRQSGIGAFYLFQSAPLQATLHLVFGFSFAQVGSAALELQGPGAQVILPHNSYLELLLTGGVLLLGIVLFLMGRAFRNLWQSNRQEEGGMVDRCILICLLVLSCWMLVYPVIYEPITGCLFWIIIGYGNRVYVSKPTEARLAN